MIHCAQQDALSTCLWDPPNITPALSGRIRRSVMYGSQPENGGTAADRPDCLRLLHITATEGRHMHTAMCTHAQTQVPALLLFNISGSLHSGADLTLAIFFYFSNIYFYIHIYMYRQHFSNILSISKSHQITYSFCFGCVFWLSNWLQARWFAWHFLDILILI